MHGVPIVFSMAATDVCAAVERPEAEPHAELFEIYDGDGRLHLLALQQHSACIVWLDEAAARRWVSLVHGLQSECPARLLAGRTGCSSSAPPESMPETQ